MLCSINSNNLMNTSITSFVCQFPAVLEEYKKRLRSDPSLQLKAVCVEMGVKYSRMIDWTSRQGIFVRKLQAEARGEKPLAGISQAFIQFSPSGRRSSCGLRGVRYFMCQHPVNMRKGIDSLFNLIVSESPISPMTGDVFVFFSKNRQSVKLLKWDSDGFLLYQKRLERGSFEMPRKNADGNTPRRYLPR